MIYLYKDPKGEKVFQKTPSQVNSQVNTVLGTTPKHQRRNSMPLCNINLPSVDDREREELKQSLRHLEELVQEKTRIILDLQRSLDAESESRNTGSSLDSGIQNNYNNMSV